MFLHKLDASRFKKLAASLQNTDFYKLDATPGKLNHVRENGQMVTNLFTSCVRISCSWFVREVDNLQQQA